MTDIDTTSQNTTSQNSATDLRRVARTTATLTIVSGVSALIFGILVLIWPKTTLLDGRFTTVVVASRPTAICWVAVGAAV